MELKKRVRVINTAVVVTFLLAGGTSVRAFSKPTYKVSAITGPTLWRTIRAGMSEAQLAAVLPGLTPTSSTDTLAAPDAEVSGFTFKVRVYLAGGRVNSVTLSSEKALANDVGEAIAAKYGPALNPYSCRWVTTMRICNGEWTATGHVRISLTNATVQGASLTKVTYEVIDTSGI